MKGIPDFKKILIYLITFFIIRHFCYFFSLFSLESSTHITVHHRASAGISYAQAGDSLVIALQKLNSSIFTVRKDYAALNLNLIYRYLLIHCKGRAGENPIFGISFTLKPNKNWLQGLISSIYYSQFSKLENFYVGHLCELSAQPQERIGGQGITGRREPLLSGSSLPFSSLLGFSQEYSHARRENGGSKKDRSWNM
jgi:hypothetical protein